ncbi:hypothetical protein BH10PSE1_BH10PSE1_16160 [soil metagenome]
MDDQYFLDLTDRARLDLLAARRWLNQPGSGLRAQLRLARLNRALIELQFAPMRWAFGRHSDVRVRLAEGYSIYYSVDDERRIVVVRRIFGPHQDQTAL